jgi:hypothetical protein
MIYEGNMGSYLKVKTEGKATEYLNLDAVVKLKIEDDAVQNIWRITLYGYDDKLLLIRVFSGPDEMHTWRINTLGTRS